MSRTCILRQLQQRGGGGCTKLQPNSTSSSWRGTRQASGASGCCCCCPLVLWCTGWCTLSKQWMQTIHRFQHFLGHWLLLSCKRRERGGISQCYCTNDPFWFANNSRLGRKIWNKKSKKAPFTMHLWFWINLSLFFLGASGALTSENIRAHPDTIVGQIDLPPEFLEYSFKFPK